MTKMCPKTSSEKRHVPRRQLLIKLSFFCPLWTLKILRKLTTVYKKYMFAFFVDNRLQTQKIAKQLPKLDPKNNQHVPKSILKNLSFFGTVSEVILVPKVSKK